MHQLSPNLWLNVIPFLNPSESLCLRTINKASKGKVDACFVALRRNLERELDELAALEHHSIQVYREKWLALLGLANAQQMEKNPSQVESFANLAASIVMERLQSSSWHERSRAWAEDDFLTGLS
jgi:hypothetical protein